MKYDFIEIEEKGTSGVKNSKFVCKGKINLKKYEFILKIEKKEREYEIDTRNDKFVIECLLDKKDKLIELYVKKDNELFLVCKIKNNLIKRLIKRFCDTRLILRIRHIFKAIGKIIKFAWKEYHFLVPPKLWGKYFKKFIIAIGLKPSINYYNPFKPKDYNKWLLKNQKEEETQKFSYNPLISIVIPVYNIEREFLTDALDSILNQTYENFEVCIADDASTKKETIDTLKEYELRDRRIKVVYRKENGHISAATNSALEIAKGEYVALMDDDDTIPSNALYEVVKVLNKDKKIDMIYTDEDKMEMNGTLCEPHFKPDYSPDTLFGGNYICHFSFFRNSILKKIGGFRSEYVGAQDYDLVLRFVEQTKNIYHIPKVLYHWRKVPGSTAVTIENKEYAILNGQKAVEDALKRRKLKGKVVIPLKTTHYIVEYDIANKPKISIIIPTKDCSKYLKKCIDSIYEKTTYKNYEVIVVNNRSIDEKTFKLFDEYKNKYKNFEVIDADIPFNYSKINNLAVEKSSGEYIVLLNNDTEVITENWLELMLGYAMQNHIGAVGAKLLYKDNTVQHGGIILGLGGVAGHAFLNVSRNSYGMYGKLLTPYDCGGVTAACLMVSKKKYEEVKGLEEQLEVAFNDVDFNLKLLDKGYYNIFLPMVELYHSESKSRGLDDLPEKKKRFQREQKYMLDKWQDKLLKDKFYNPNFSLKHSYFLDKKNDNE